MCCVSSSTGMQSILIGFHRSWVGLGCLYSLSLTVLHPWWAEKACKTVRGRGCLLAASRQWLINEIIGQHWGGAKKEKELLTVGFGKNKCEVSLKRKKSRKRGRKERKDKGDDVIRTHYFGFLLTLSWPCLFFSLSFSCSSLKDSLDLVQISSNHSIPGAVSYLFILQTSSKDGGNGPEKHNWINHSLQERHYYNRTAAKSSPCYVWTFQQLQQSWQNYTVASQLLSPLACA